MALSGILLAPGLATLWTAWSKLVAPVPPQPLPLSLTGAGAFAINLTCALVLAGYRHHSGSLTRAAFLSARNDGSARCRTHTGGLTPSLALGVACPP